MLDAVDARHPHPDEPVSKVVPLPLLRGLRPLGAAAELIAAVFRHQVHRDAAGHGLRRAARGLVDHFLRHRFVVVRLHGAVAHQAVGHHAVDQHHRLRAAGAADGEVGLLHRARAADVGRVQRDAEHELAEALDGLGRRHRVQHIARQHLLLDVALHVDHRRRTRDGDRFLQRADAQLHVDRRREVRLQLDAFAGLGVESGKRKGQGVGAGTQIDDTVLAVLVGHRRLHLFDQHGAGGFDRHARHHCARGVFHRAGKRALCARQGGHQHEPCHNQQKRSYCKLTRHLFPQSAIEPNASAAKKMRAREKQP